MIVKTCGITNVDDALTALDAGADWIGLNMVAGPRRIEIDTVRAIITALPAPDRVVVLVMFEKLSGDQYRDRKGAGTEGGEDAQQVERLDALHAIGVRRLQLYGAVTPADLVRLRDRGFETILVHHVGDTGAITALSALLRKCGNGPPDYILFDAADANQLGGTGRRANWGAIMKARESFSKRQNEDRKTSWPPFLLAGGLNPENVAEAIRTVRPFGVDVSSGVESSPGVKDVEKMRRFVSQARAAFARLAIDPSDRS